MVYTAGFHTSYTISQNILPHVELYVILISHLARLITISLFTTSLLLLLQVTVTAEILSCYVDVMAILKLEEHRGTKIRSVYLKQ